MFFTTRESEKRGAKKRQSVRRSLGSVRKSRQSKGEERIALSLAHLDSTAHSAEFSQRASRQEFVATAANEQQGKACVEVNLSHTECVQLACPLALSLTLSSTPIGCLPHMVLLVSAKYCTNASASCFSMHPIPRRSNRSISWKIVAVGPPDSRHWKEKRLPQLRKEGRSTDNDKRQIRNAARCSTAAQRCT